MNWYAFVVGSCVGIWVIFYLNLRVAKARIAGLEEALEATVLALKRAVEVINENTRSLGYLETVMHTHDKVLSRLNEENKLKQGKNHESS